MFNPFRKSDRHRKQSAIGAALCGGMLTIAGFPTLFLNEGRAVKTAQSLAEGSAAVVAVDATRVDEQHEGQLIYVAGHATTEETLSDDEFGVSANAIRLERIAEMYQWDEVEQKVTRKVDGKTISETEYDYEKIWSDEQIPSSKFHIPARHANPAEKRFASKSIEAKLVTLGTYQLSSGQISRITESEPLALDLSGVPGPLAASLRVDGGTETNDQGFYWSRATQSSTPVVAEQDTLSPEAVEPESDSLESDSLENREPEIGDLRIRYSVTRPADVSVIAQQWGQSFQPFKTRSGRKLSMLSNGIVSAEQMFDRAKAENTMFTWGLRVFGTAFMMIGIGLLMSPLTSVTDRIPILGNIVGMGATFVSVLVGGAFALLTISSAWLFYRPLVAVPLIIVGVGLLVLLLRMANKPVDDDEPVTVELAEP